MNVLIVLVMVVLPSIGLLLAIRTWHRARGGIRAVARVTGHVRDEVPGPLDREYSSRDLPVVEFADESGTRRRVTLREEIVDTETSVRVVYPPGRPHEARIDRMLYLYTLPGLLIAPALCLAVIYAALVLYASLAS